MFPLGSVLFPAMPLALRLFEPRYLRMLGDLLDDETPTFGVVLIERGHEVGGGDKRFDVGTLARVVEVEAHEGFMSLVAIGTQRFGVTQWTGEQPYPRAAVEPLAELSWEDDLWSQATAVEVKVREAIGLAGGELGELSDDPLSRCWQLAAVAPLGPLDHVRLLASGSTSELLSMTEEMVDDLIVTLQLTAED
jgi:uncharacterized protein